MRFITILFANSEGRALRAMPTRPLIVALRLFFLSFSLTLIHSFSLTLIHSLFHIFSFSFFLSFSLPFSPSRLHKEYISSLYVFSLFPFLAHLFSFYLQSISSFTSLCLSSSTISCNHSWDGFFVCSDFMIVRYKRLLENFIKVFEIYLTKIIVFNFNKRLTMPIFGLMLIGHFLFCSISALSLESF